MEVIHDKENQRFYIATENPNKEKIGFFKQEEFLLSTLSYSQPREGVLNYASTFVPHDLRGKGMASKLILFALDYAKENGYKVIPSCWAVDKIYQSNKEKYQDIIV